MKKIIVQKFGGSSVADTDKIKNVAKNVIKEKELGNDVAVVVSAMGKSTDNLVKLAKEISPNPDSREMDMLLSTGEGVSIALLAMAIITALGNGVWKLVMALAIGQIPRFARMVRSSVLTLRNMEYVEAAKCFGSSSMQIILKHILPNGIGPIVVSATLTLGSVILSISSMGYLGLGVASPTPEWGTIISENKVNIQYFPYLGIIPGICIMLTVMSINFIGDGLRDAFDPKSKK